MVVEDACPPCSLAPACAPPCWQEDQQHAGGGRRRRPHVPASAAPPDHARLPTSGLWRTAAALQTLQPASGGHAHFQAGERGDSQALGLHGALGSPGIELLTV